MSVLIQALHGGLDMAHRQEISPVFRVAGSLSLQLYCTYHRLLHMRVAVNSHTSPVYKKNKLSSLVCIFETTV